MSAGPPPPSGLGASDVPELYRRGAPPLALTTNVAVFTTFPAVAVIVTAVVTRACATGIANDADVAPESTVTLGGGCPVPGSLDASATTIPPAGATLSRVTVAYTVVGPMTLYALSDSAERTGAAIVRLALCDPVPAAAVIEAVVSCETGDVLTVKSAETAPAGAVTLAGTDAAEALLESAMTSPPAGAGPLNVMVPVDDEPPFTPAGANARPIGTGATTVRPARSDALPLVAAKKTAVSCPTGEVAMSKVAEALPAATVTLDGTDAAELLLLN